MFLNETKGPDKEYGEYYQIIIPKNHLQSNDSNNNFLAPLEQMQQKIKREKAKNAFNFFT